MTGLIDSHAHLTDENLSGQVNEVLDRARAAGVVGVIAIASDLADSERTIALSRQHGDVWATAGVHPHQAGQANDADWSQLSAMFADPAVVACGEIGLDYHYDFADQPTQQRVFARQLALAADADLPLVVHCREALDDAIRLLEQASFRDRPVVFHCFSGTVAEAEAIADRGWRLSFTGLVTYKSARDAQAVARDYPSDGLMIETDSPYLSPVPLRGKFPNEPANLIHTARFLADLRGQPIEELIAQTTTNTRQFFSLGS
ncbi:MAG: TatD family hydrolase [bacterium]|nr:TatD family hydrolase [bacterium]